MNNREENNSNSYVLPEYFNLLTPEAKEPWKKLPNDMSHVLLRGSNDKLSINLNNSNRFNKSNIKLHKPVRHLFFKGKPFTKTNFHELLS